MTIAPDLSHLITANFGAEFFYQISPNDGSTVLEYPVSLDGIPFTLANGDLAGFCDDLNAPEPDCDNLTTFYYHSPDESVYAVSCSGSSATSSFPYLSGLGDKQIAMSPDGSWIYLLGEGEVSYYDPFTDEIVLTLPLLDGDGNTLMNVNGVACSPTDVVYFSSGTNVYELNFISGVGTVVATEVSSEIVDLTFLGESLLMVTEAEVGDVFEGNTWPIPASITGVNGAGDLFNGNLLLSTTGGMFYEFDLNQPQEAAASYQNNLPFMDGDLGTACVGPIITPEQGDCYAADVLEYVEGSSYSGGSIAVVRTDPSQALGEPEEIDQLVFVSLGYGGSLTLGFDGAVPNEDGPDLEIVETTYNNTSCNSYPEYADVYVSQDGINFEFAKTVCRSDRLVDISDAGSFEWILAVKIVNNNALSATPDAFDVDGVRALHNCEGTTDEGAGEIEDANAWLTTYPNPTHGFSQAIFGVETDGPALLEVYDLNGRLVETLYNSIALGGQEYRLDFNASSLPNGVYLYRLTTPAGVTNAKLVLGR
jgi:hypothetical protein